MNQVEAVRVFPHPLERVFRRYVDHVGWSEWAGFGPVRLVQEGAPERDGKGAVRAFSWVPGLREEVTLVNHRVVIHGELRDRAGDLAAHLNGHQRIDRAGRRDPGLDRSTRDERGLES